MIPEADFDRERLFMARAIGARPAQRLKHASRGESVRLNYKALSLMVTLAADDVLRVIDETTIDPLDALREFFETEEMFAR